MEVATPSWQNSLFRKLLLADMKSQLPGSSAHKDESNLNDDDVRRLLAMASILATSDESTDRKMSYEICSRLVEIRGNSSSGIFTAADIILSRLGNFPGRSLLRSVFGGPSNRTSEDGPRNLALEQIVREIENTPNMRDVEPEPLTDFQFRLFESMSQGRSVSVSAPTSAGKSYVLRLDLIRRLRSSNESIVYLVPTRALIREVSSSVRAALRKANLTNVPVRTAPFPLTKAAAPAGAVYVLTQERLSTLLSSRDAPAWITTLIVDEAHNIQDDARGVSLQGAIEHVSRAFPDAEIHFASPLSRNPEFLLKLFHQDGNALVETQSPVSQNIIFVSEVRGHKREANFSMKLDAAIVDLGIRSLAFDFRGSKCRQHANFAASITRDDEATIIFANRPADAEEIARSLCDVVSQANPTSEAVLELIEFIKEEIHPDYSLVDCLPKGIGFHFGYMPPIVRSRVEDLFKAGEIKFLSCTSTLLQGVNLPARHIIIENPKRGKSGPMPRRDFLNLAGRAGRLLREFHGNVWCIRPSTWEEKTYEGEPLFTIDSALSIAMKDGGSIVNRTLSKEVPASEVEYGESVVGKLYADLMRGGSEASLDTWRTESNSEGLEKTKTAILGLNVTLPLEIVEANKSIRPDKLQRLYDHLSAELYSENLLPLHPYTQGAYDRLKEIIRTVEVVLNESSNESYKYYSQLANQWIHDSTLGQIIQRELDHKPLSSQQELSTRVRGLLETLEKVVRFRLVKFFLAYTSVLEHLLVQRSREDLIPKIEPIHIYLECGTSDPTTLSLIALGLSRTTALALRGKVTFPAKATPEACLAIISATDLARIQIPSICRRELFEITGATEV